MAKGVQYNKRSKKWYARLMVEGVLYSESCDSKKEAKVKRQELERRHLTSTTRISPIGLQKQINKLKDQVENLTRSQASIINMITREEE